MTISSISGIFRIVVAKYLTAVDAEPSRSHGHEIGGLSALYSEISAVKKIDGVRYAYVGIDEIISVNGDVTWYDARANDAKRSPEWRMYYQENDVTIAMSEGDFLVIGLLNDGSMIFLVVGKDSQKESAICSLFNIREIRPKGFTVIDTSDRKTPLDIFERTILDSLGIEYDYSDDSYIEELLRVFEGRFPSTSAFSAYARASIKIKPEEMDPDILLVNYLDREELLFKTLEKHLVGVRLKQGFSSVEDFVAFSLSVQNRRKSRAGHALENHLEAIFISQKLRFDKGVRTEGNSKPDFIFPGKREYDASTFPQSKLIMLGVKTTCKDRWRQILAEAERIPIKHLLTLEPSISNEQTAEMMRQKVQLVLPSSLHHTYSLHQQKWLWSLSSFIRFVRENELS